MLARGISASALLSLIGIGLQFLVQLIIARGLGVQEFGLYSYVMSWISLLMLLAVLGSDSVFLRFIPEYIAAQRWSLLRGLLQVGSRLVMAASLMIAAIGLTVVWFSMAPGTRQDAFIVGLMLLPFLSLNLLRQATLRAFKHVVMARSPELLIQPSLLGVLFILIWKVMPVGEPIAAHALILLGIALLVALIVGGLFVRHVIPVEVNLAAADYRTESWIDMSLPMMLSAAFFVIAAEVDKIMVGMMVGDSEVGLYAMASRIAVLVLFGLQSVNVIAAPMIAEYHTSKSPGEFQNLVRKLTLIIFLITVPAFMSVLLFGEAVLTLLGDEFTRAYPALLILACGQLVNAATGPVGFLLTMTGHHHTSLRIITFTLIMSILLNLPAIYYFEVNGAAGATAFSIALRNVLSWWQVRKLLGINAAIFSNFTK